MLNKDWAYRRGDIYYADLNPVCGSEQGGMRPVVVIQNNTGNKYAPTLIVAMVTIRTIDKKRIKSYLGKTTKRELLGIDKALLRSLSLNYLICIKEPRN